MSTSPPKSPPQYSLGMLFIVMLAASMAVAPAFYFIRAARGEPGMQLVGMLMVLAGPLLMMVLVSIVRSVVQWLRER